MRQLSVPKLGFQRFSPSQEIASEVEEAAKAVEATAAAEKGVRLRVTEVVLLQLRRCWHPSVFLTPLAHRFWKVRPLT